MLSSTVSVLLALASSVSATIRHPHIENRSAQVSYVTKTTYTTTTYNAKYIVNTNIQTAGVYTIIPNALTMTVATPSAYLYLETSSLTSSVITNYHTSTVTVSTTTTKPTTTTTKATSSTSKPATSSSTTKSSSTTSAAPSSTHGSSAAQFSALVTCLTQGTSPTTDLYSTVSAADLTACYSACNADSSCKLYGYNANTGACSLYSANAGITTISSGIFFATRSNGANVCYTNQLAAASATTSTTSSTTTKKITTTTTTPKTTSTAATKTYAPLKGTGVYSNTATASSKTSATPVLSSSCNGKAEGTTCGSFHTCQAGACAYYNTDSQCGAVNNACNTSGGYACVNYVCTDILYNANNCGAAYEACGSSLSCNNGTCVDTTSDSNNCGAVGATCPAGSGCKNSTCIDTTSDDENCSVVGYAVSFSS